MRGVLTRAIVPFAAMALAACNQGGVALTNATPEEVAEAAKEAGAVTMRPGQWETRVETLEIEMPGMEPAMLEQMKNSPNRVQTHSFCVTPAEAGKPNAAFLTGKANENCTFRNYTMAGGRIDSTMACGSGTDEMTVTTSGTYSAEAMDGIAQITMAAMNMKMKGKVTSRRTGECTTPPPAKGG